MADWAIGVKFEGDTSGLSKALADAQNLYQKSQEKAAAASRAVDDADARVNAAMLQRSLATGTAMEQQSQRQVDIALRNLERRKQAANDAASQAEAAERNLTRTVETESQKRTAAALASAKQMGSALLSGLGFGVGAGAGIMAAQEIGSAVRDATTAFADMGHEIGHIQMLFNTSAENASVLRYAFERLGMDGGQLSKVAVTMTRDMMTNTKEFENLGVATHDANGHLLNAYDVLQNLRHVVGAVGEDNDKLATIQLTLARSTGGSTQAMAQLMEYLNLTDEQMAALASDASSTSQVFDEQMVKSATALWNEFKLVQSEQKGLSIGLATALSPAVEWATHAALVAIEVMKNYGKVLMDVAGIAFEAAKLMDPINIIKNLIQGKDLLAGVKSAWDSLSTDFMNAGTWDQMLGKVDAQIEVAKKLGQLQDQQGDNTLPGPVKGAGPKTPAGPDLVVEAMRRDVDAIKQAQQDREQLLNDATNAEQAAGKKRIEIAQEVQRAEATVYAAAIQQLRDQEAAAALATKHEVQNEQDALKARQKIRDQEEADLTAEQKALDDAYAERQQQRDAEIAGLQAQLAAMQAVDQQAANAAALQKLRDALTAEQGKDMNRIRSESVADYAKRVQDHNDALAKAAADLAAEEAKQADEAAQAAIQAKITAVTAAGTEDRKAVESQKASIQQQIDAVKQLASADKDATDQRVEDMNRAQEQMSESTNAQIADLQKQAKVVDDAFTNAIANYKAQLDASKVAADAQIADSKRTTDAIITDLQRQIAARDPNAGKLGSGGTVNVPGIGTVTSQEYANAAACEADGKHQWNWSDHTCFLKPAAAPAAPPPGGAPVGSAGGSASGGKPIAGYTPAGVPYYATGGSMVLTEPTALVGLNSGRVSAIAGEAGPEPVTFGGGDRAGQVIIPITVELDGRVIAEVVSRYQGGSAVVQGYARRR